MSQAWPLDFEPFCGQARSFLDGFRRGDAGWASRPDGEVDLYGDADAAYALWILGDLDEVAVPEREAWASRIQAAQDRDSGWFDRSLLAGHGVPHATAFATGALVLLGACPLHPLRYAESLFASRVSTDAWLDGFRWSQVWTGSHAAGAAAAVLDAPKGLSLPEDWSEALLAALDARVDPATGFWKRALHDRVLRKPTTLDLGGAAHFWWLYDRLGRSIPHPARAVAGIVRLQRRTGLWGSRIFGGRFPQGIDFDALHGLRVAWPRLSEVERRGLRGPVEAALRRYADAAHAWLLAEGSCTRLIRKTHKLVGTLDALAELDHGSRTILGSSCVATSRPLRSALTRVCWQ